MPFHRLRKFVTPLKRCLADALLWTRFCPNVALYSRRTKTLAATFSSVILLSEFSGRVPTWPFVYPQTQAKSLCPCKFKETLACQSLLRGKTCQSNGEIYTQTFQGFRNWKFKIWSVLLALMRCSTCDTGISVGQAIFYHFQKGLRLKPLKTFFGKRIFFQEQWFPTLIMGALRALEDA